MKTLLILRHGKSSWKDVTLADHDRPLKKRGRESAERMGRFLRESNLLPDRILTSSATRATETARLVTSTAQFDDEMEVVPDLYHADPTALTLILSRVPDSYNRLLIIGHNPGLEDWLAKLTGYAKAFPTAALAQIELPVKSWIELSLDTRGTLQGLWRPKEIS